MKLELILLAISPSIGFILWIYLKDKYDREPKMTLIRFFILGVFISAIAIIAESILIKINIFKGNSSIIYTSFIIAGLVEEGLKALILIPNLLNNKYFNEKLDGIIYSVFLSLGFATVENIIYVLLEDSSIAFDVGITRGVISIPAHIMFAVSMGYYISKYKFSQSKIKKREYLLLSVLVPVLLHGAFDFLLIIPYKWSVIIFIVYIIFLCKMSLDKLYDYEQNSKKIFLRKKRH